MKIKFYCPKCFYPTREATVESRYKQDKLFKELTKFACDICTYEHFKYKKEEEE